MPFDDAAALAASYRASFHALKDRGRLRPGQSLLVLARPADADLAAVELGKIMGLSVIAVASTQEKVDLCLSHGAHVGVVYGRGPFDREGHTALAQLSKETTGPACADVIFDVVGDHYTEHALRAISWAGKYLVVDFAAGAVPRIALNLALLKGCDIVGVFWGLQGEPGPRRVPGELGEAPGDVCGRRALG
jgi:NADPH2:quinone reductase